MGSNAVPYLSLSVSQAAELPHPSHPEPIDHSTFTSLLKHRAEHQSAQIAVGFPHLKEKECLTYTFEQLYNQSSKLAQRIRCIIAPRCKDGIQPVIALLGPSGPVFLLHATASWLLGAAVLPIAIGTTSKGANGLLSKCGCNVVLYSKRQASQIAEMQSMIETESGPLMMEWTDLEANEADRETSLPPIYTAKPKDNLVIFHSSGSSGTPKPLAQCHGFWSKSLLTASGREAAAFTTTPLFHGGLSDLFRSVQASASLYFFPWHLSIAPTVDNIVESVKSCGQDIRYFLSVPFILEMLIKSNEGSSLLKEMDMVSTGGAPLPEAVGDTATKEHNIKLVSRLGSSECGFLMSSYRDFDADKDWSWLRVPDKLGQQWLKFESISEQEADVYELVVSSEWPTKQLSNRPDGSFATGDLYERHPEHPNQWRYKRRNDDIIVMVNGKKIPGSLVESALCSSPLIKEAIVFGSNRALLGAIIFPSDSSDQERNLQKLKEHLQMMNRSMPSHGRIALEMIHVGDSNLQSSLPRSSKGTLQKGIALDTMAGLIDDVYRRFEEGEAPRTEDRKSLSGEELRAWLKALVESVCDNSIGVDDDFYRSGIDSIMAARIRAGVHQGLEIDGFRLQSKDVYDHPTITLLSKYIDNRGKAIEAGRDEIMMNMVKKYSNFSPIKAKDDGITSNGGITVILTGATGALGCRLLYELLEGEHKVDNVVCLVRAKDGMAARERVKSAVKERGLILAEKKIDCVSNLFELSMKKCLTGAKSLSIIHSAWIVNFALRVESFEEDCISGLKDLLDFFRSCANAARFIFCSSLASVLGGKPPFKEVASDDSSDSGQTGYGNSKWVAEKICEQAGSNVVVARIGQLCGDTKKGVWNTSEAWPLMIRTAQEIGSLPESGPDIDWLPVDAASKAIVELARAPTVPSRNFHVALPPSVKRPNWPTFVQWLKESDLAFTLTSKNEWLKHVNEKKAQIKGSALIDIWTSIPDHGSADDSNVDMKQALSVSKSLGVVKAVDKDLCKKMVQAWKTSGFLT